MFRKCITDTITTFGKTKIPKIEVTKIQKRMMFLLHEYQAQGLLKSYSLPIPKGGVIKSENEIDKILDEMGKATGYAVKAQVQTGGRGLGYFKENNFKGGVHVVSSKDEVKNLIPKMLNKTLITKQTGEKGLPCKALFIVEKVQVVDEKYFSISLDRKYQGPVLLASAKGGVSIEDIAHSDPSAIKILPVNYMKGLSEADALKFVNSLGYHEELAIQAKDIVMKLYKAFCEKDALMIEINPLATIKENGKNIVKVIDSKVSIDENAEFRQKDLAAIIDTSSKNIQELEAEKFNLNFIKLDGNIGCLVNGAGLAMATMDIIKLHGGNPANFLDVGGGAEEEGMIEALRILSNDPEVKSILVNIFGGILRCDLLVNAIIKASDKYKLTKSIVLRLKGTNADKASEIIKNSGLKNIMFIQDLDKAAQKSVELSKLN
jgi:succinyl-CoA synthetase beta subunit